MLKTIYNNCAGIDVHKKIIVVTIAKTDSNNITEYQTKSFPTFTDDLIECRKWLVSNDTLDVCMESTGKYWIPVFNVLETECNCVITHPIIAIARFLLTCAFHILNNKIPFDSGRFDELLNKKIKKHNKSVKNTDDMISYLTKLGYCITLQNN